jgi:hypothetical protein
MRNKFILTLAVLPLCACASFQKQGTVTIQGRGTEKLTEIGDPLLGTGKYAEKNVPKEFAMGYAKGISDQVQREYWQMQDEVSSRRAPYRGDGNGGGVEGYSRSRDQNATPAEGTPHYYRITLPESVDPDGVRHAPRDVTVPIVE